MAAPNSAAAITAQLTAMAGGLPLLEIKCANAPASNPTEKMNDCEKEQICQKCADINDLAAKDNKLKRTATGPGRDGGDAAAATFKRRQGMRLRGKGPFGKKLKRKVSPSGLKKFTTDCAFEDWKEGRPPPRPGPNPKADPRMRGLSADHIHEIQLGGSPTSSRNLRMMSSKANEWIGSTLQGYDPAEHKGVSPDCCK